MSSTDLRFTHRNAHRDWLHGQSKLPQGFSAGVVTVPFTPRETGKPSSMRFSLIALDAASDAFAAVFTRNAFPGAPVKIGRQRLTEQRLRAIVVNNKISNVCAPNGEAIAERICQAVATELGCSGTEILPSSTGVIGWQLPVEELCAATPELVGTLQSESILPVAEGIMTTDLYPKVRSASVGEGRVVGIAKGAGMVEPNMATMLVYVLTDLDVPRGVLRAQLAAAADASFNRISIDSDQSTSDTLALLSSRQIPCSDAGLFSQALSQVCCDLAEDVVRNGEGVHHVIQCDVRSAPSEALARGVGKAIVNSPLVKSAICGNDANVGRLIMAIGKYLAGTPDIDPTRMVLRIAGHVVFQNGAFLLNPELDAQLHKSLVEAELYGSAAPNAAGVFRPPIDYPPHERCVDLDVDLGMGTAQQRVLGADLSHEYVSENADYRS